MNKYNIKKSILLLALVITVKTGIFASDRNSLPSISNAVLSYQNYDNVIISIDLLGFTTGNIETRNKILSSTYETIGSPNDPFGFQDFSIFLGFNLDRFIKKINIGIIYGLHNTTLTNKSTKASIIGLPIFSSNIGFENIIEDEYKSETEMSFANSTSVYGFTINYQLIKPINEKKLISWNGISIGSGLVASFNNIKAEVDISSFLELESGTLGFVIDLDSSSFTIPFEVTTGVEFLSVISITASAAVDVQISSAGVTVDLYPKSDSIGSKMIKEIVNELLIESTQNNYSNVVNLKPRINIGAGIGIGSILFNISLSYYLDSGMILGVNVILKF